MTLRARLELEDSFASTITCTICGVSALAVVHLKSFPDYVSCAACGAAFVMEDGGDRAMYGSIPQEYPETRDFALKQWTSLEAIAALAEAERPGSQSANHGGAEEAVRPTAAAADDPSLQSASAIDIQVVPQAGHLGEAEPAPEAEAGAFEQVEPEAETFGEAEPAPEAEAGAFEQAEPEEETFGEAEPEARPVVVPAPAPEAEAPQEPFEWPAPASEEPEPAPKLQPAEEPFAWPSSASEEPEPSAEPQTAEQPFEWPAPASEEPEPAPESQPAKEPFAWPAPASEQPEPAEEPQVVEAQAPELERALTEQPEPAEPPPGDESWEPAPGRRFRVRFLGTEAGIPSGVCAHCLRGSPKRKLVAVGAVVGPGGQPRRQAFSLPLCSSCFRRARAKSEEERSARMMAHLISILVAAVAMVGTLATGLVPLDSPLLAAGLLGVLGIAGYGIPAWLLLERATRFPKPEDAIFVRSTLLVSAHPHAGETLFDWRSPGFASQFLEANAEQAGETIFEVADPLATRETPTNEPSA